MRLNHGVHQLVAADDGVCGANINTQGATNAPVLNNKSDAAWAFNAVFGIQRLDGLTSDAAESFNALSPARGALVDSCAIMDDGLGVGLAVWVATARALGLGQSGTNVCNPADINAGWC